MIEQENKEADKVANDEKNNENVIEFIGYSHTAVVSFTNPKYIKKIKKLYEERKDDFKYFIENEDGSICAKLPTKWIKINAGSKTGRSMTEEQKEAARIRLAKAREKIQKNKKLKSNDSSSFN